MIEGNLKRRRYIFRNEKLKADVLARYRRKAERDWEEMEIIRKNIDSGKKPRKKYRNSNCFVDTRLSYMFPLNCFTKEEAIDHAVERMVTGREGLFVLLTNRPLTAEKTIELYRARNQVEGAFRDLKHGIDWRPPDVRTRWRSREGSSSVSLHFSASPWYVSCIRNTGTVRRNPYARSWARSHLRFW